MRLRSRYGLFRVTCGVVMVSFVGWTILNSWLDLNGRRHRCEDFQEEFPKVAFQSVAVVEKPLLSTSRRPDYRERLSTDTKKPKPFFVTTTKATITIAREKDVMKDTGDGVVSIGAVGGHPSTVLSTNRLKNTGNVWSEHQTVKYQKASEPLNDHWCRLQHIRVDWEGCLRTCMDHTAWEDRKIPDSWQPTDSTNSYIASWAISPAGEFSRFFIQSVTATNRTKLTGGDAWRVHVRGPASIAPTVVDHGNGKYEALFLPLEAGTYRATIFLDYTLCNGLTDPPRDWFRKGNSQGKNQPEGSLLGRKPYLMAPFRNGETIAFSVPSNKLDGNSRSCASSCKSLLWDGMGRWVAGTWNPYVTAPKNRDPRSKEGTLWIFGDSVANDFHHSLSTGPYRLLCSQIFSSCRRTYHWVYDMAKYWGDGVTSPREPTPDGKDYDHERVLADVKKTLFHPKMDEKSVLIINLGVHFAATVNFTNYKRVIDDLIRTVHEGESRPGGGQRKVFRGRLIWKTTTALNRHRFPQPHRDVRRFLTFPRVELYNAYALWAMCRAGVDVIDVYPISNSFPGGTVGPNDPVHYSGDVFRDIERLLFEMFRPNNLT